MLKIVLANLRAWKCPSEDGVTTVEYAIMLALIAMAVAFFGQGLAGQVNGTFSRMLSVLSSST